MEHLIKLPDLTEDELTATRVALRRGMALYHAWAEEGPGNPKYRTYESVLYVVYRKFGGHRTVDELREQDADLL